VGPKRAGLLMFNSSYKHLFFLAASAIIFASTCTPLLADAQQLHPTSIQKKLAKLEASSSSQIGLYAIDTANHRRFQYHAKKCFPMCSTAKMMVVSAVLKKSMADSRLLQHKATYQKKDLVAYSPITKKHITSGMTISELCAAAMMLSDNTAMNLLIKNLGGPKAVNSFAHSIGDSKFRLDRREPESSSAIPGDVRDTTTPEAMAKSLQRLALGNALALPQRERLQTWLKNNTTGNSRIRAGVPKNWIVGDKTGTGNYGATNDIGVIWPPQCSPIIVTIYVTQNKKDTPPRNDVIASATRIVINAFAHTNKCIKIEG